jgi:lipoprotein-anchoring transpeptidase ErfK/SrfK
VRLHRRHEPDGGASGCVRLLNQDIIDLYERVPIKAPIVVKQ